jgi:hypothetical protein
MTIPWRILEIGRQPAPDFAASGIIDLVGDLPLSEFSPPLQ